MSVRKKIETERLHRVENTAKVNVEKLQTKTKKYKVKWAK